MIWCVFYVSEGKMALPMSHVAELLFWSYHWAVTSGQAFPKGFRVVPVGLGYVMPWEQQTLTSQELCTWYLYFLLPRESRTAVLPVLAPCPTLLQLWELPHGRVLPWSPWEGKREHGNHFTVLGESHEHIQLHGGEIQSSQVLGRRKKPEILVRCNKKHHFCFKSMDRHSNTRVSSLLSQGGDRTEKLFGQGHTARIQT